MKCMRIAILEDNQAILDMVTIALEMQGHTISTHMDSSSLLRTLFAESNYGRVLPYDLLIVDMMLPGEMSGLQTVEYIHNSISPNKLPAIIITGVSQAEVERIKVSLPTVPVIRKPFKISMLRQVIEAVTMSCV